MEVFIQVEATKLDLIQHSKLLSVVSQLLCQLIWIHFPIQGHLGSPDAIVNISFDQGLLIEDQETKSIEIEFSRIRVLT